MADVEAKKICIKMYWTPAKMLLADVAEYSLPNAVTVTLAISGSPIDGCG